MLSERLINVLISISDDISRCLLIDLGNKKAFGNRDQLRRAKILAKMRSVGIDSIDLSETYQCVRTNMSEEKKDPTISQFVKFTYGAIFDEKKVSRFAYRYEFFRKKVFRPIGEVIPESEIKYDPKNNIRSTFLSLVTETYPNGHEDEVMDIIKVDLQKDKFGNYFKIIGNSETMFTSHFDTVSREKVKVGLRTMQRDGEEFIFTDGNSILGADDKAGVAIMLHMIEHNIPGFYYFFQGEERGGIGSSLLSSEYESFPNLKEIKRCISFDRRNYFSVITSQLGRNCCSTQFADALCSELNSNGLQVSLDPTGIYTDSASLMDDIPECTNISVGYFNEHTEDECQNINFLEKLAKAVLKVKWETLPTSRKVGYSEEVKKKYGNFIKELKTSNFFNDIKIVGEDGIGYLNIHMDGISLIEAHADMLELSSLLKKYKLDPDLNFNDNKIKIVLK